MHDLIITFEFTEKLQSCPLVNFANGLVEVRRVGNPLIVLASWLGSTNLRTPPLNRCNSIFIPKGAGKILAGLVAGAEGNFRNTPLGFTRK